MTATGETGPVSSRETRLGRSRTEEPGTSGVEVEGKEVGGEGVGVRR